MNEVHPGESSGFVTRGNLERVVADLEGDSIRVQQLVTICGQSRDIVTLVTNISTS